MTRSRPLLGSFLWPALVGLLFGAIELLRLKAGNYSPGIRQLAEVLGIHAVLGLLFGAPVVLAVALATRLWPAREGGLWRRWLHRLAPVAPAFATLFGMGGIVVNVLYLPDRLSGVSLRADLAMLALVALAAFAWAHRPAPRTLDRPLVALALAAVAAAAVWAALPPPAPAQAPSRVAGGGRPPNIFLILLDTLRPDHLGAYGSPRPTSPRIDQLAAEGLLFERAFSSTNWTRPAVASLFTSTMPSRHGATEVNRRISPDLPLLAEALSARHLAVGFFTSGVNVEPSDGYDRGVDVFHTQSSRPLTSTTLFMRHIVLPVWPGSRRLLAGYQAPDGHSRPEELTDRAIDWVRRVDPRRPIFAYLHYAGPHSPYDPPPGIAGTFAKRPTVPELTDPPSDNWAGPDALTPADRQQMIDQYDEEILLHDEQVGRLFDELAAIGRLDHAVFMIISDHGEAFGEHGVWAHTESLFTEVVRIPLIVWTSLDWGQPRRVDINASIIDLAPTLAEVAGAPRPASFDGGSLLPWLEERQDEQRTIFIENPKHDELGVRTAEWVYFEGKTNQGNGRWLYRPEDTAEAENLADRHPEVVAELSELVRARRAMDRSRAVEAETMEIDPEREEQLRALGYLQ